LSSETTRASEARSFPGGGSEVASAAVDDDIEGARRAGGPREVTACCASGRDPLS
jgi:hypothetical protein